VFLYVLILTSFSLFQYAEAKSLKVVFLNPQTADDSFWGPVTQFMEAACDDLGMELEVHVADFNHLTMIKHAKTAVSGPEKPDFLVFKNFRQQAAKILKIAADANVPAFMFNAGLLEENRKKYGGPREQFTSWIGQMLPDDEQAGYDLAQILLDEAKKMALTGRDGKIHAVGVSGPVADTPAILRNRGFERAVEERNDVVLHQIVAAEWKQDPAKDRFNRLMQRYPESTVGWSANDPMSLGIIDAMKEMGKTPGQDIVTGGIDWTEDALKAVERGEMTATLGGHFMEGGWVMVLLYDYANGIDFASDAVEMTSKMSALTANNLKAYLQNFGERDWSKIDFKQFSKKENPNLTSYDFSIDAILQQFQ
jgi:ABC-type sugar transport system substrate-binding protein